MKIIDLLNMISKGEEVPKKIRFDNTYWNRICGEKYPYYINDNDSDLFIYFFRKNLTFTLNDEIEILDDEEKGLPEKLKLRSNCGGTFASEQKFRNSRDDEIAFKINEIIDYLEKQSKGE